MVAVVTRVPAAKLIISGRRDDLGYERELRALVTDLDLEDNVEFRFNITEAEKRDLLFSSRVLVLPSAVEGFGIVVLEANACGVPVVASSGVPAGAVQQGANGLRYPFGQINALAGALIEVLTNDSLHATLAANSLVFAAGFGWKEVGSRYEQVVQKAATRMGSHPAGSG
jgi:glycosyltransferase involved in cell wall biosynthesis